MGTVPTGSMESKLRAYYLEWIADLPNQPDIQRYLQEFRQRSLNIINTSGGKISRMGARAGFPAPKMLDLSLVAGHIYDEMQVTAIKAGIASGVGANTIAGAMFKAGMGKSFRDLVRLARTETTSAYWKNQWDSVAGMGLVMVWEPENGARTCSSCLAKAGLIVDSPAVRDHPNGRCTLIPSLPEEVGIRGKGPNPRFDRGISEWNAQDTPKQVQRIFGHGLDRALVADVTVQQALTLMVGQGWTTGQAFKYLWSTWGSKGATWDISRGESTQIRRALSHYAQELWEGLDTGSTDQLMYRGGNIPPSGMASWTTAKRVAAAYAVRRNAPMHEAVVPRKALRYRVSAPGSLQEEVLVVGNIRTGKTNYVDAPVHMYSFQDYTEIN